MEWSLYLKNYFSCTSPHHLNILLLYCIELSLGQSAGKNNDAKHQKYMSINQSRDHGDLLARVIRHHTHLTFKKEENPLSFSVWQTEGGRCLIFVWDINGDLDFRLMLMFIIEKKEEKRWEMEEKFSLGLRSREGIFNLPTFLSTWTGDNPHYKLDTFYVCAAEIWRQCLHHTG